MDIFDAVHPVRTVPEVAQPDFTRKRHILLEPLFVLPSAGIRLKGFPVFLAYFLEKIRDGLFLDGTITADVPVTRLNVDLDVCNSRAILTPVMLLFHQDVHLVHRESRAVLVEKVRKRLPQSYERYSALVMDLISHLRS
jgi:hypothetical protein